MIKGTHKRNLLFIISFLLITISCGRNTIYIESVRFPSELWKLDNQADFNCVISDTSSVCDIFFTVRTGTSYPFRNIWLFVKTTSPNGKSITDTLQYTLADEKGKWYGRGFGDIHELSLPYKTGIYFPQKGAYSFQIRHGMRIEDLKGVYDFGLKIEKQRK